MFLKIALFGDFLKGFSSPTQAARPRCDQQLPELDYIQSVYAVHEGLIFRQRAPGLKARQ